MAELANEGPSQLVLRLALLAAGAASLVVLTGALADGVRYACLGVIALATLLAAPERRRAGGGWWALLAVGAALSIAGAAIALAAETVGGLVAVVGSVLVVVAATIGFPAQE